MNKYIHPNNEEMFFNLNSKQRKEYMESQYQLDTVLGEDPKPVQESNCSRLHRLYTERVQNDFEHKLPPEPKLVQEMEPEEFFGLTPIERSRVFAKETSALNVQVAGNHYKDLKIQPIEYIHANNLAFIEGSVVKYITRWRSKGGIKDLEKVKHFVDLLIELEGLKVS